MVQGFCIGSSTPYSWLQVGKVQTQSGSVLIGKNGMTSDIQKSVS
jgi:hypothetical protein